jgi:transcriptional regulator with XRE-family HTH domain
MAIEYKEIGRRIARRRTELGLKQYELCELIDVNYKYVSNLETGRNAPSLEMVMKLCNALQTTPNYFLIGTENTGKSDSDAGMLEKINTLCERDRRILDGIVDSFLNVKS